MAYGDAVVELEPLQREVEGPFERYVPALAYATAYPYVSPAEED